MEKTIILYGSSSGNTKAIAQKIAKALGCESHIYDVATISVEQVTEFDNLILGTSTWGLGDLQDDWYSFLPELTCLDLSTKKIAIFGLGDAESYPDTFVDGMGLLYKRLKEKGCTIIGKTPTCGYSFIASQAAIDGNFIGLPIDEDNESNKTNERIEHWISSIKPELN